ncbi:MAG: membrane associated rhomboid family serine protease [Myxococcota bacterium]|jgi:membrane associated rhomboid family serine protease
MSDRGVVRSQVTDLVVGTRTRAVMVARWTSLLWIVESVDWLVLSQRLDQFGIRPRELSGLWGILFAPFLHGGFGHLIANTIPFILLGFLTSARKRSDFYVVAIGSALIGGLGTWLIGGAGTVHIGASGVVFGMLGFLMGRGIFERSLSSIALSVAVTAGFGGMLWGVLPTVGAGISWEGHLFGFIGGMIIARLMGKKLRERQG